LQTLSAKAKQLGSIANALLPTETSASIAERTPQTVLIWFREADSASIGMRARLRILGLSVGAVIQSKKLVSGTSRSLIAGKPLRP